MSCSCQKYKKSSSVDPVEVAYCDKEVKDGWVEFVTFDFIKYCMINYLHIFNILDEFCVSHFESFPDDNIQLVKLIFLQLNRNNLINKTKNYSYLYSHLKRRPSGSHSHSQKKLKWRPWLVTV